MMRNFSIALTVMLCLGVATKAAEPVCPELEKLKQVWQSKAFLTLTFTQQIHSEIFESVDTTAGHLWAGKNGRFRLESPDQTMVSNGIEFWSYSVENEQVLVDSIQEIDSWNPLTLLYDPDGVYMCIEEKNFDTTSRFTLQARDSLTYPQSFFLDVETSSHTPVKIQYVDENDSRIEIAIEKFTPAADLPDTLFEFHPPQGVEVIYMP